MWCPRCLQENSVEPQGAAWFCRGCSLRFTEHTQVVRPLIRDGLWVERGTGHLVRVLQLDSDPFDPTGAVWYQYEANPLDVSQAMLAQDFRYYFRPHVEDGRGSPTSLPCKPLEEWSSAEGTVYLVLDVDEQAGQVHVVPLGGGHRSFRVAAADFLRQFRRFQRVTDYARLLEED